MRLLVKRDELLSKLRLLVRFKTPESRVEDADRLARQVLQWLDSLGKWDVVELYAEVVEEGDVVKMKVEKAILYKKVGEFGE